MKTKQILITLLLFTSTLLYAQTPKFQWVIGGGSQGTGWNTGNPAMESCKWLGTDARGNVYGMSSIFDFNIQIDTSIIAAGWGYDDFAVFSYRCDGSLRWVRYYGSTSMDYTGGLTVDQDGNVFVSGFVAISSYTDGHFGDTTVLANPYMNRGTFVAKLDSNGKTIWLSFLDPPTASPGNWVLQMEADNQGNRCVLIKFTTPGMWGNYPIPQKGYYVIKVDKNNGNTMDVIKLEFNSSDDLFSVNFNVDEMNNYYLNTQVNDTIFLGNNIATAGYSGGSPRANSVLAKYSSTGNFIWYKELGGIFANAARKILLGKPLIVNNKVYINGYTNNNLTIFGDTINNPYLTLFKGDIPFNACFNKNNGNFISLKHLFNTDYCDFKFVSTISDKIYLSNISHGKILLNATDTLKPYGGEYSESYPFIIAIDTNLTQFEWGVATKVTGNVTRIESLTVDNTGNIYAGGKFSDSIFNSFGSSIQSHGGNSDFFIAKIAYSNNCGCSVAQTFPQFVSLNNNALIVKGTATGVTDSLYWYWGDGSKTKYLAQNTNVSHTYSVGGNYSVSLRSYNYCGTKDSTIQITGVGITEQELKYLAAYPNPVNHTLTIENPYQSSMQLSIYSITGKLLYSHQYQSYTTTIDMSPYEAGIYFVEMKLEDGRKAVRKVAKE